MSDAFAGGLAGAAALLTFVVLHAIWIVPIWGVLAMLPLAALVGVLAGAALEPLAAGGRLPAAPLDGPAFAAILVATLVPTAVAAAVQGPVPQHDIPWGRLLWPLALAAPAGVLVALLLGGSPASAALLGLAALALALTLGHNVPFFPPGASGWTKAFALVVLPELVGGLAFALARGPIAAAARAALP